MDLVGIIVYTCKHLFIWALPFQSLDLANLLHPPRSPIISYIYHTLLILSPRPVSQNRVLLGSVLFASLLMFKHLYLSLAPAYFVFLLRHYCLTAPSAAAPKPGAQAEAGVRTRSQVRWSIVWCPSASQHETIQEACIDTIQALLKHGGPVSEADTFMVTFQGGQRLCSPSLSRLTVPPLLLYLTASRQLH